MPRTDRGSRVIAASLERTWAALVDPGALLKWLPPGEMTGRFERFDARPGGSYRMVLTYCDASGAPGKASADSDIVEARFVDIVPGERIVLAVDFVSDDPANARAVALASAALAGQSECLAGDPEVIGCARRSRRNRRCGLPRLPAVPPPGVRELAAAA